MKNKVTETDTVTETTPRESFVLYFPWKEYFERLSNESCKKLIIAIFNYAENRKETKFEDNETFFAYKVMSEQIGRDVKKYERRRLNALKNKTNQNETEPTETNENETENLP